MVGNNKKPIISSGFVVAGIKSSGLIGKDIRIIPPKRRKK